MATPTNETTFQAAWIAYDRAYVAAGGGSKGTAAGMKARNAVLFGGALIEGPAELPASFSARSSARVLGGLEVRS